MAVARTVAVLLTFALAPALVPAPAQAVPTIPVRVRIVKGSRQGPPAVDPRLADLRDQLGAAAYQRWDQVSQQDSSMAFNKPLTMRLPDGSTLEVALVDARKETATFAVKVPALKTDVRRWTISKDQRLVHQVTDEKDGAAYFVSIRPWP